MEAKEDVPASSSTQNELQTYKQKVSIIKPTNPMFQNDENIKKRSSTPVLRGGIDNPFAAASKGNENNAAPKINAVRGVTPTKKISWKEAM